MKIMLVDDEQSIRVLIEMALKREGYDFCYAVDGEHALAEHDKEKPDLMIIDVMMPNINGFDLCRLLRESGSNVPIIILSAKGDIVDKSVGFRAGADDYLVKPFNAQELLLRIEALMRRRVRQNELADNVDSSQTLVTGDLEINFSKQEVYLGGKAVELTPKEYKILAFLANHRGEIFSREQIQEYIWGKDHIGDLTSVAVFIRKIRGKIEREPSSPAYLQTIWGVGYKFTEEQGH